MGFPRAEEGILHTEGFLFLRRALGMKKGFAVKQTLKTQVVGMARGLCVPNAALYQTEPHPVKKPFLARTKMKDKRFFGTCGKKERACFDKIFRNKRLAVKSWMGLFLTL